jgi:hypothetical protein
MLLILVIFVHACYGKFKGDELTRKGGDTSNFVLKNIAGGFASL